MTAIPAIPASVFDFLRDIAAHNNREWFQANKDRYERDMREPLRAFIRGMAEPLAEISPELVADDGLQGGSLYRIYRDTRFSPDKTPYKTHAGVHFFHRRTRGPASEKAAAPGLYLHLDPEGSFMALGVHCSSAKQLKPVRQAIVDRPDDWADVKATLAERGLSLGGDALRGAPRGFPKDHPYIEDIKRTDYLTLEHLTEPDITAPAFPNRILTFARSSSPLGAFLGRSLDMGW